ncbi:MAG: hypothetical protein IKM31_01960 [Oscillospiraceae bacterium]|nr:hypothetical protein [Oscillospiraceae bacterium]
MHNIENGPKLIIGLGGTGSNVVDMIRKRLEQQPLSELICIDADDPAPAEKASTEPENDSDR